MEICCSTFLEIFFSHLAHLAQELPQERLRMSPSIRQVHQQVLSIPETLRQVQGQ